MGYKQYNSPFNKGYSDPERAVTNYDIRKLKNMPDFTTPETETANGTKDAEVDGESEKSINSADKLIAEGNSGSSKGRLANLTERINDSSTPPSKRLKLENRKDRIEDKYKRQEDIGEIANKRKSLARDTREKKKNTKRYR